MTKDELKAFHHLMPYAKLLFPDHTVPEDFVLLSDEIKQGSKQLTADARKIYGTGGESARAKSGIPATSGVGGSAPGPHHQTYPAPHTFSSVGVPPATGYVSNWARGENQLQQAGVQIHDYRPFSYAEYCRWACFWCLL